MFFIECFSECIERAVTLTKKSSTIPLNQCPICKSKTPKRSLNPSAAASKLCAIYEDIVRAYSEINGGNEDWIHEAGIRGSDAYYTGGGAPLENLSQLYPYPEKPKPSSASGLENISESADTELDSDSSDLLTDLEDDATQLEEGTSKIYDETTQPMTKTEPSQPSSPLIYSLEETQLSCDRLIINTQELEKLAAINDSIDKELAELEKKLTLKEKEIMTSNDETLKENKESVITRDFAKTEMKEETQKKKMKEKRIKVVNNSEKTKPATSTKTGAKKSKLSTEVEDEIFDPKSALKKQKTTKDEVDSVTLKGLTTTGIKDEKLLIQLTKFSDKFNCPILPDFDAQVSHLLVPTGPNLIVKKRTMKYFEALLLGMEIISFEWIEACLKAGKLLSSSAYKIIGDEIGLKQAKKRSETDYSKVFSSHKFYLYGEFSQPPRDQLEKLIKASNSILIENANEISRGTIVLADPTSQFTFEKDAEIIKKHPIVSPGWFLDSISCGKALDFHGYLIL